MSSTYFRLFLRRDSLCECDEVKVVANPHESRTWCPCASSALPHPFRITISDQTYVNLQLSNRVLGVRQRRMRFYSMFVNINLILNQYGFQNPIVIRDCRLLTPEFVYTCSTSQPMGILPRLEVRGLKHHNTLWPGLKSTMSMSLSLERSHRAEGRWTELLNPRYSIA